MLCSIKELDGLVLAARDGEIGHAREAYFDDARWVVRHVVAEAGSWLLGRQVLISPHAIARIARAHRRLDVALTKKKIKDAPGIETDQPVSRQYEIPYYDYYGYPYYWDGSGLWGAGALPLGGESMLTPRDAPLPREITQAMAAAARDADTHLRSSAEVIGYHVEAIDGAIGHIDDFLFDDRSWQIRYAVVDTRNWLRGRLVLIAPASITSIDWNVRRVHVKVSRDAVKASPPYERTATLSDDEERRIQRHYEGWS